MEEDTETTIEQVMSHPRYNETLSMFLAGSLDLAASDKSIDGIFKDLGRYGAAIWTLYLHFTGGLTLPRLKDLCRISGMFSPGRARALLIYLQLLGYVSALAKTRPGPRQYVPSPSLFAAIKKQAQLGLQALTFIDANIRQALDRFDEPEFFRVFITHLGEGSVNAARLVDQRDDLWTIFLMRHAGSQILQLLLVKDISLGGEPIPLSMVAVARQLNVARSHVAHVLRLAEAAELIRRQDTGAIVLLDKLRRQAGIAFTLQLIGYASCAAVAYEAVRSKTKQWSP